MLQRGYIRCQWAPPAQHDGRQKIATTRATFKTEVGALIAGYAGGVLDTMLEPT